MSETAVELLLKTQPFARLSPQVVEGAAADLVLMTFQPGTVLAVQGRTALDHIYLVRSGRLEIFLETEGQKILRGTLGAGDIFGAISILMNAGLSIRSLAVEEEASLYLMTQKSFLDLCDRHRFVYDYFREVFKERMQNESYARAIAGSQVTHFLSRIPPFSFLPEEEVQSIALDISSEFFPKDTVVFVQGETRIDGLYVIYKGAAERYFEENQTKTLASVLGEGDMFGGISMLVNDMLAVRTLRTIEDTLFFKIPHKAFFDLSRRYEAFTEFFTDAFGKRMMDRSYAAVIAKSTPHLTESLPLLNQPVAGICSRRLVTCTSDLSIQKAAESMSGSAVSSILIRGPGGEPIGIVTDNDLRTKVIARGINIERPVAEIMSAPIRSISENALISEALMAMMQGSIKHLAVTGADERIVGIMTHQDVMAARGQSPLFIIREISSAVDVEAMAKLHTRLPVMVQGLIRAGTPARYINRFVTAISDAVLKRVIELTLREMGPPPVRFVFMILGSEGRKEQTLKTDQDNAVVYEDILPAEEPPVRDYFLRMGDAVCTGLNRSGYAFCNADVMARNPKLCQPLSVWKRRFSEWIHAAEAEDLLYSSIFFDFRGGYGHADLIERLREHLQESLVGWSGFFRHLTQNALLHKPPLGFFRNFVVESKGEHRNKFDIKQAMLPIVDYARIYALKHGVAETNTLERLHQLTQKGLIPAKDYSEIEQGYSFLMQLRLVRQLGAILEDGTPPDNYINPKELSGIEQRLLKEIFIRIGNLQTRMSFDFTGEP
ncbi:MAG: putative nucleotidyltransferase substrate binding domain-containing protein [Hyphomicrobiales bacterium]